MSGYTQTQKLVNEMDESGTFPPELTVKAAQVVLTTCTHYILITQLPQVVFVTPHTIMTTVLCLPVRDCSIVVHGILHSTGRAVPSERAILPCAVCKARPLQAPWYW